MTLHNAAVYLRISSDPTGQEAGVTRQREDCEALAARLGVNLVATFEDNDVSAYSGVRRPGYEALLTAMERREFGTLICWHTDRLYRSLKDLERLIDVAESREVVIRTVNGGDLDLSTSTGKMLARILGSVARQESEHKAERQRRANAQRASQGEWWSTGRCFGYTLEGAVDPAEAALIVEAANDVLAGMSLRQVARRWNAAGVKSSRGATWTTTRVKRMLLNQRYTGVRVYHGKVVGTGKWAAILDPETHAGLVAVLRDPARGKAISYERRHLGSYRYVCGRCGAKMVRHVSTHSSGDRHSRYTCTASPHLSRTQTELDAYVEKVALEYLRRGEGLPGRLSHGDGEADANELRVQKIALEAQMDDAAGMFAEGSITANQLKITTAKLRAKVAEIETSLAVFARRSPVAAMIADGPDGLESRWEAASPDIKGKVVDELFTVVVMPAPKGRYFNPDYIEFRPAAGSELPD
ncbi:recombinase family protein [Mycolicibacillus trivialis]